MTTASALDATQGVSAQFQIAPLKIAQNIQKQEGEAAISLTKPAGKATGHSTPSSTGNNIDITA